MYSTLPSDYPLRPRKKLSICCGLKAYWIVNVIAAFFHGLNALLMVILYEVNDRHDVLYDLTMVDEIVWKGFSYNTVYVAIIIIRRLAHY